MVGRNIYIWSIVNRFGTQIIGFFGNVLIARQLAPDDYGLIAMLAIIMGIAMNFTDSGFADCLIRKIEADKKDFATIFTYNVTIGLFMYLLIFITAPYIAIFFERSELIEISRIMGLSILIRAFTITEFTKLRKELKFKEIAIIQIISIIISTIVAVVLAYFGAGFWALVIQTLSIGIVNIISIVVLSKWKPYFYFSYKRFKEMKNFSFNMLISYFTNQIGQNLYSVFIGKFHSTSSLGFYRQAQKITEQSVYSLNAIILTTTYPLLAKETNHEERYKTYISLFNRFLLLHFLISFFLIGAADPLIEILFGVKWIESTPYFQLMLITFLFYPLTTLNSNIAKIYGKAKLYRNLTFFRNSLLIIALIITMRGSVLYILYGQICAAYISVLTDMILCGRIINMRILKQLKIVIKQIWIPLFGLSIAWVTTNLISSKILKITIYSMMFFLIYIIANEIAKNDTYREFKNKLIAMTLKLIK